ncbi:hypothetical protein H6F76_10540 [Leptolyngbya sp. FACHB-321]|uniref:hypothetical protein n=1 Tax=Leptolyngbya sp. FACHB-321 TaxID=2692807 RepID=UPI001682B8F0|nr:hypothetical protein [Leptolyngbya sp. FACHB-321]MBD2035459.1 hypothetical protein [Leptolyngbya sp. FACHB-321]
MMATNQPHRSVRHFAQAVGSLGLRSQFVSIWAIVSLTTAAVGQAQQVVPLPPPPTVSVPGLTNAPLSTNSTATPGGETVFLAPINRQGASSQYTVYVNGDSSYLLQQVRAIEPTASIQRYQGQAIIQARTFGDEASARRLIAALNAQGIIAEMTMGNAEMTAAPSKVVTTSRYLVVVPGSREELPALTERVIRMGIRQEAIQEKNAPLGPHLEIGPFAQHSDAKKISQFLNGGGFDSRVYYSR